MSDYNVQFKVRNNRILQAIRAQGYKNNAEFCRATGITPTEFGKYINLKQNPMTDSGGIRQGATRICEALGLLPDELWSDDQMFLKLEKNSREVEVSATEIKQLMSADVHYLPSPEEEAVRLEDKENIELALALLTPREKKVIKMRFYNEMTYEEVGKEFDVTRERIRQIESKALRKMRAPKVGVFFNEKMTFGHEKPDLRMLKAKGFDDIHKREEAE